MAITRGDVGFSGRGDEWYGAVPWPLGLWYRDIVPGDCHVARLPRNDMEVSGRLRMDGAVSKPERCGTGDPSPTVAVWWTKKGRVKTLPYGFLLGVARTPASLYSPLINEGGGRFRVDTASHSSTGLPHQCAHWFAMTWWMGDCHTT